jgi:hypothetical protein
MPTPLPGVPWTSGGVDDMTADIEARNDAAEESSGGGLSEAEVTAIAQAETATVVDSAPGLLNTLNEISAAIGDDPDFAAVVLGLIDEKAPLAGPYVKDYAEATRTAGDLTLNQTAVTAVNTGLDLTLTAAAGDLIRYGMDGIIGNEASCSTSTRWSAARQSTPLGLASPRWGRLRACRSGRWTTSPRRSRSRCPHVGRWSPATSKAAL